MQADGWHDILPSKFFNPDMTSAFWVTIKEDAVACIGFEFAQEVIITIMTQNIPIIYAGIDS